MKTGTRQALPLFLMLVAAAALALAMPGSARAQEQKADAQAEQITPDQLNEYAQAYVEISKVREEVDNELAHTYKDEDKTKLRQKLTDQVDAIYKKHSLTPKEYERMTFVVSVDAAQRKAFQDLVTKISGGNGGENGG